LDLLRLPRYLRLQIPDRARELRTLLSATDPQGIELSNVRAQRGVRRLELGHARVELRALRGDGAPIVAGVEAPALVHEIQRREPGQRGGCQEKRSLEWADPSDDDVIGQLAHRVRAHAKINRPGFG